jgi:hypothetical protein
MQFLEKSMDYLFVDFKKLSILSAFKTRGKTLTICPAEKRENVIKWRYTSAKRCAVRIGTRSARDTRISKFRYSSTFVTG